MNRKQITNATTVLIGDCLDGLRSLPADSVHCCVTSPPYWGLRSYLPADHPAKSLELGSERTPEEYVAKLVAIFAEVRRVLRPDGTCWLNLGDSYNNTDKWGGGGSNTGKHVRDTDGEVPSWQSKRQKRPDIPGLKPKDLVGIPWRVALALQADGWWLRDDVIWHKPSPMPGSQRDRTTKAHEYVFMLTKSARYYYDDVAIKEDASGKPPGNKMPTKGGREWETGNAKHRTSANLHKIEAAEKKTRRSVWTIASAPYKAAHFATYPPRLVEPCILAGTSERGCCPQCGAPWQRMIERTRVMRPRPNDYTKRTGEEGTGNACSNSVAGVSVVTTGWQPTCTCQMVGHPPTPYTVLDPFGGSGTTAGVAEAHGRRAILCELSPDYVELMPDRIAMVIESLRKSKKSKRSRQVKSSAKSQINLFL